jgi:hypothetical protein
MLQIANFPRSEIETDPWVSVYGPIASVVSLGTLGLFYTLVLFSVLGLTGRELNVAVFLTCVLVLPFTCTAVETYLQRPDPARLWGSLA